MSTPVNKPPQGFAAVPESMLESLPVTSTEKGVLRTIGEPVFNLQDVRRAISERTDLPKKRQRDLLSAIDRASKLFRLDPVCIPLDVPAISEMLAAINPVAAGIRSPQTFSNISTR